MTRPQPTTAEDLVDQVLAGLGGHGNALIFESHSLIDTLKLRVYDAPCLFMDRLLKSLVRDQGVHQSAVHGFRCTSKRIEPNRALSLRALEGENGRVADAHS